MLGDVLLLEETHRKAASQILEVALAKMKVTNHKYVIAVSGESGTGKSEIAHCLSELFKQQGLKAKILHSDNCYKTTPHERHAWRQAHGVKSIGYTEYNWDKIEENIEDFRQGREAKMPCVDRLTDQDDILLTHFENIDILILEGLYAIKANTVDLRIFIEITYQETKKAQLKRGKEVMNEWREKELAREQEVVQSLKELANYLITRDFKLVAAK
ncbi:uridine kinase [bacterium]|nr:uridine kinase [bacterium]